MPVIQASEKAGIMSVGYHVDDTKFAPNGWLTAAIWDWTGLFPKLVAEAKAGTYKPAVQRYFLKDGVVSLAPFGAKVTKETQDKIAATRTKMGTDEFLAFTGPVKDQTGAVKIADGVKPDINTLESMNWLAEGVIGTLPR